MTDATTGRGAGRETPPGHDRIVAPTPHEASDPEAPAPGTKATTDFEETGRGGTTERAGTGTAGGAGTAERPGITERAGATERAGTAERAGAAERVRAAEPTGTGDTTGHGSITGHGSTTGHGDTTGLLPHDECDKLELRLRNAVSGFVDSPKQAVEEADHVVEEIAGRFTEALTRRRRTLRTSWQDGEADKATHSDTEQLRLALRDYRELAERLLHS
ncbi:hypothetical protein ACIBL8_10145 [Streptomyces sp. NPDC050523]|uniref:hypothetical protein n=1 Tax=Streptomyces sp. NPDC050523 TaxID=3365622 RepID=UPI0037A7697C